MSLEEPTCHCIPVLREFFGIEHPILLAPMADVSGGRLAAAVTAAGGLGLIGGGYGDAEWLQREFDEATGRKVGVGFITWSLARNPELLDVALARQPATIMLSFGDLGPFADRIHAGRHSAELPGADARAGTPCPGSRRGHHRGAGRRGGRARNGCSFNVHAGARHRRPRRRTLGQNACGGRRWCRRRSRTGGGAGARRRRRAGRHPVVGQHGGAGDTTSPATSHRGVRGRHPPHAGL